MLYCNITNVDHWIGVFSIRIRWLELLIIFRWRLEMNIPHHLLFLTSIVSDWCRCLSGSPYLQTSQFLMKEAAWYYLHVLNMTNISRNLSLKVITYTRTKRSLVCYKVWKCIMEKGFVKNCKKCTYEKN